MGTSGPVVGPVTLIGVWEEANIPPGGGPGLIEFVGAVPMLGVTLPDRGQFFALSYQFTAQITAGTYSIRIVLNGTPYSDFISIGAGDPQRGVIDLRPGVLAGASPELFDVAANCEMERDVAAAMPAGNDIVAMVWCVLNRGRLP